MEIPCNTYRFGALLFVLGVLNQMTMVCRLRGTLPIIAFILLVLACTLLVRYYANALDTWNGLLYSSILYSVGMLVVFKVFPPRELTGAEH
jgi:hypothetical protein